jgi:hypothetical protein
MGMNSIKYYFVLVLMVCTHGLSAQDKPGDSLQPLDDLTMYLNFQYQSCPGVCDGHVSTVVDGGVPPYSYSWSNGTTGPEIQDVCSGWGSVTVTDALGEVISVDFELPDIPAPYVFITGLIITQPTDGQNNGSIALDSIPFMDSSFYHVDSFWSIDSVNFIPYYIFPHLGPGVYHLYVIDPLSGCVVRANEIILYDITGVEDLDISFQLFPNPVTTELHLYSDVPLEVELLDMNGRKIFSERSSDDHSIQMADYPEGIYFLKISDGEKLAFRKMVKTKG